MLGFIKGLTETVVKTAVRVPVAIVADVVTLGGEVSGKGGQCYTGDMIDSINDSMKEMSKDE